MTEITDFSRIRISLLKLYPFSEEQLNQFTGRLIFNKIKRKGFLINPNQVSNCLSFIHRGSFRLYTNTELNELTISFFTENEWVADNILIG